MPTTLPHPPDTPESGPYHRSTFARIRGLFWLRDEFRMYRYRLAELPAFEPDDGPVVHRDHTPDLELYEPTSPWWMPKKSFLETARDRLAAGEHVYTVVVDGLLQHYAWLADRRESMVVQEVEQTFHFAIPGAVLYDAHTIPDARGRGLHSRSIMARLRDSRALAGARWAYVGCLAANRASRGGIERCGFAYYSSLHRIEALGFARRWQSTNSA
jgi:hypothetical protein